ncbi:MAG: hypothetical protein JW913_07315 [Chitinispirillaceae bacterium]|nr:hypothetical protein [Chitinispirillaceae bacterium]
MRLSVLALLLFALPVRAQEETFTVMSLEGTARVQRSQKRAWEKIDRGGKLYDNDLVETFFQTKLILQFGSGNLVILGSNSKVLLNIAAKTESDRTITEISLTLFGGGVFSKALKSCRINLYTANAVGVMDSGSVTTIAEGKTGETGFQVLGGLIYVRNIAQQKGIELRPGLTTMIQPNKEPTAPLYITHRHVAVLKHYFGDEYITTELDASGIKPTDERSGGPAGFSAFSGRSRGYVDEGMHKPLFSLNKIYGSILDERAGHYCFYRPMPPVYPPVDGKGIVALNTDFGISDREISPRLMPVFSWHQGRFSGGLRFSFLENASDQFTAGFTSLAGILDKIDHLAWNTDDDAWALYAGAIHHITFGYGLIVNDFTNTSHNNIFHPLGLKGHVRIFDELSVQAFTSDLSAPLISGIYITFEPSLYHLGAGYVADFNQYVQPIGSSRSMRYASLPRSDSLFPDVEHFASRVHCYVVDGAVDIVNRYDFQLKLVVEFAQKLYNGKDGYVTRMPSFHCDVKKTSFGGGFIVESGRLLSNQFDISSMDNRYRIKSYPYNEFIDTVLTPNNVLSRERHTMGFSLFLKINPFRGTDIDLSYKQDLIGKRTVKVVSLDTIVSRTVPFDFSFRLRAAINDSLLKFIRYAEVSLQQSHGPLYPAGMGLPFYSWTFNGGYDVLTVPFFFNIAFETGGRFFYIDTGRRRDDRISRGDLIGEFRAGINWGF